MRHLFTYGTLMAEDIIREVSGATLTSVAATLQRYRRVCVKDEDYPAIVPDASRQVAGMLYMNVPMSSWPLLDHFEGEMYSREVVEVELNDGSCVTAETYVARPEFMDCLVDDEWDFDEFLRKNSDRFRKAYLV